MAVTVVVTGGGVGGVRGLSPSGKKSERTSCVFWSGTMALKTSAVASAVLWVNLCVTRVCKKVKEPLLKLFNHCCWEALKQASKQLFR